MSETQLPAVAKTIFLECKKCEAERYHVVVAHTTSTSAKVKCEVCGSSKTYKLPKAGGAKKPLAGAAAKKRAASATAKKNAHEQEFNTLMAANEKTDAVKYNMKGKFPVNTKLDHPKFGLGVIRMSLDDKIEVVFQDEVRSLVHNRT